MKVSIITATYNSSAHIIDCLESVAKQNYADIEHLIVDGLSSDNTLDIVKEYTRYNTHIKYSSERDQGIYDALNKGIERASGELIGFVHSDDCLASNSIIEQVVNWFKETNCDGVYGDLKYVDANDMDKTVRYWRSSAFEPQKLNQGWMPPHPTLFLKKELYKRYGRFNTNLKIAADYEFILRLFKEKDLRFAYLDEIITLMRVGGASNRNLQNILNKSREDLMALKMHHIPYPYWVLFQKNVSKLPQWLGN